MGAVTAQEQTTKSIASQDEPDKPSIVVASIDDDGKKTDAIAKSNATKSNSKEGDDNGTGENEEHTNKNETESLEEVFLPAEGAAEKEHSSSLAIFFVLF